MRTRTVWFSITGMMLLGALVLPAILCTDPNSNHDAQSLGKVKVVKERIRQSSSSGVDQAPAPPQRLAEIWPERAQQLLPRVKEWIAVAQQGPFEAESPQSRPIATTQPSASRPTSLPTTDTSAMSHDIVESLLGAAAIGSTSVGAAIMRDTELVLDVAMHSDLLSAASLVAALDDYKRQGTGQLPLNMASGNLLEQIVANPTALALCLRSNEHFGLLSFDVEACAKGIAQSPLLATWAGRFRSAARADAIPGLCRFSANVPLYANIVFAEANETYEAAKERTVAGVQRHVALATALEKPLRSLEAGNPSAVYALRQLVEKRGDLLKNCTAEKLAASIVKADALDLAAGVADTEASSALCLEEATINALSGFRDLQEMSYVDEIGALSASETWSARVATEEEKGLAARVEARRDVGIVGRALESEKLATCRKQVLEVVASAPDGARYFLSPADDLRSLCPAFKVGGRALIGALALEHDPEEQRYWQGAGAKAVARYFEYDPTTKRFTRTKAGWARLTTCVMVGEGTCRAAGTITEGKLPSLKDLKDVAIFGGVVVGTAILTALTAGAGAGVGVGARAVQAAQRIGKRLNTLG